jgi:outer membrane protein assembly factor BamB
VLTAVPNQLAVLDASTGAVQWSAPFTTSQSGNPAVTATTIFLTGADGLVAAFPLAGCGAATCSPSWSDTSAGEVSGSPRVGGNLVYVAAGQGNEVLAYAAGGCGATTCAPVGTVHLTGSTFMSPVVDSATLFAQERDAVAAYRLP